MFVVYVESNFLLEIARGQDQAEAASRLLTAAQAGTVDLRCPSFSLAEPFAALDRLRSQRNDVQRRVQEESKRQFRRVPNQNSLLDQLVGLGDTFGAISDGEQQGLLSIIQTLFGCGRILPFRSEEFKLAIDLMSELDLGAQDSIVLATIIKDLHSDKAARPSLFVSSDGRAFDSPDVKAELEPFGCTYFRSFETAVNRLQL